MGAKIMLVSSAQAIAGQRIVRTFGSVYAVAAGATGPEGAAPSATAPRTPSVAAAQVEPV